MKNHIIISLLFLSVGLSQQEYNSNDIVEMDNGLWTEKFSDEPITGKVYGYFGEVKPLKKVYVGNIVNGKKEGKWTSYFNNGYFYNGGKKYEENWNNGKIDGIGYSWYENGNLETEITFKKQPRGYLYHIVNTDNGIWVIVPGKFSLAFSMAPEFYRRIYQKNPIILMNVDILYNIMIIQISL